MKFLFIFATNIYDKKYWESTIFCNKIYKQIKLI